MQQKRGVLLACLFLLPLLIQTTSAESSGNIEASTAQLSMSPNEPVVGGDATFSVILTNVGSVDAFDVKYEFFKGAVGENLFKSNVVDIPQGQSVIVSATWGSLPEGGQRQPARLGPPDADGGAGRGAAYLSPRDDGAGARLLPGRRARHHELP